MKIVSLHYARRRGGGEVEVALDDGTVLAVDPDLTVQFGLSSGMELTDDSLTRLRSAQDALSARRRLIRYLALRKKSVRDAEHYLGELKFDEASVESAVAAALHLGYLDDDRFAEAYAVTQDRAKKGPRAIRQELLMHGVDKDLVDETVAPMQEPDAQRERARAAAEKRAASLARTESDPRKAKIKLMQFLQRRGFDGDVCSQVAEELLGKDG